MTAGAALRSGAHELHVAHVYFVGYCSSNGNAVKKVDRDRTVEDDCGFGQRSVDSLNYIARTSANATLLAHTCRVRVFLRPSNISFGEYNVDGALRHALEIQAELPGPSPPVRAIAHQRHDCIPRRSLLTSLIACLLETPCWRSFLAVRPAESS